jgi:hypothetical protein
MAKAPGTQASEYNAKTHAWPNFDRSAGIGELLILAGPSASGKTTFVRAMYAHELAEDINVRLPSPMRRAPSVDIKYPTKILVRSMPTIDNGGPGVGYSTENGCVLHYALDRLSKLRIERLEDDLPLVDMLNSTSGPVTIVIIQVDRKRLVAQYATRMFAWHEEDTGRRAPKVVLSVRRLARSLDIRKLTQLARHRYSDNVDRLYSRWDELVSEIVERQRKGRDARVRVVRVEPDLRSNNGTGFRLLSFCDH